MLRLVPVRPYYGPHSNHYLPATFDPDIIQFSTLLDHFWKIHNPTTRNRQGPDIGSQYRSVIFFQDADQHTVAVQSRLDENQSKRYSLPIVTEITSKQPFYEAEEYHQQYLEKLNKFFCHI